MHIYTYIYIHIYITHTDLSIYLTYMCMHTYMYSNTNMYTIIYTYTNTYIHIKHTKKKTSLRNRGGKREKKNWKREKKTGRGRKKLEEKKLSSTASLAAMSAPSARSLAAVLVSPSALARIRSVWPCSLLDSYRASMSMPAATMASSRTSTVASCFCSSASCTLV